MNEREMSLPPGWYPANAAGVNSFLKDFEKRGSSVAAIAPHAGWYYSGRTAARSVSALDPNIETVVVIGGHLPAGAPFLFAEEQGVKTPLGIIEIDEELRADFCKQVNSSPDRYRDNTVEVLLPMVKYFFPKSKLLWLRFPAELPSFEAGKTLAQTAESLGRRIAVIGSTDLTHYGRNYGFSPQGSGRKALDWMKEVNDANFIKAVLAGEPAAVLERAEKDYSSCSAGAVLGAMGFAHEQSSAKAELLEYSTSAGEADAIPDSFVGYASIIF